MASLLALQESFVTEKFLELEEQLKKEADKPYEDTSNQILKTITKVFEKYKYFPNTLKYVLIKQELDRVKVFQQIRQHYGIMGLRYSEFLKGLLEDNFKEAQFQANSLIPNEEFIEIEYAEPSSVTDWTLRANRHAEQMIALILLLLSKGKPLEEFVIEIESKVASQIYDAKRLARTETATVINGTCLGVWMKADIPMVKWTDATETIQFVNRDGSKRVTRVCSHCRGYATGGEGGKGIYPIINLPSPCPAHPNCRCTLVPVIKNKK